MGLILIIVILLPVVGFAMDLYGLGIAKHADIYLPNISFDQTKVLLIRFARLYKWRIIEMQEKENERWYELQAGRWGLSIFGSQRVTIIIVPKDTGVECTIYSRSTMGQLFDFGANQRNLEKLTTYLTTEIEKGPVPSQTTETFRKAKFVIDYRYGLIVVGLIVIQVLGFYLNYKDKERSIPGNLLITFREGKNQEEMYKLLASYEIGSCQNWPPESNRRFLCTVPVGEEEELINKIRLVLDIASVTRWHGEK